MRPVDDPFWDEHKPGDRWNCKCELQQSDSDVTTAPLSDGKSDPARGLESNPAKAEELFSQKHPYYPQNCMSCPFARNKLMALAMDLAGRKNCNRCGKVRKSVAETEKKSNRQEYERRSINYYLHFCKNDGKLIDHNIKTIHCVVNGNNEIFTFSVE